MPGLHRLIRLLLRSHTEEVAIEEVEVFHEAEAIGTVVEAALLWMSDLMLDFAVGPRKVKVAGAQGTGTSASHITLMLVCGMALERNASCFLHANHHHHANLPEIHGMLPTETCVRNSTGRAPWPMSPCPPLHSKLSLHHSRLLLPCSALYVLPRHPMLQKHHRPVLVLSSKSARIGLAPPPRRRPAAMPGHLRPDRQTRSAPRFQPAHVPKMPVFNQRLDLLRRHRNNLDHLVDNGSTLQSLPRAV